MKASCGKRGTATHSPRTNVLRRSRHLRRIGVDKMCLRCGRFQCTGFHRPADGSDTVTGSGGTASPLRPSSFCSHGRIHAYRSRTEIEPLAGKRSDWVNSRKLWFPAKRYGWGWGLPIAVQGWIVLACYLLLIAGAVLALLRGTSLIVFFAYVAVLTVALIGICYLKGEPPRWRWGD